MFTLYSTPLSANGRKVLAVSHYLGLKPEIRHVNVYRGEGRTPEYLAVNQGGKIPTLVDGNFTLFESNAIIQYISEVHGDFRLFSRDPKERASIASWLFWESAHWQPVLIQVLSPFVGHMLLPEAVPAPSHPPKWDNEQLKPLLARLELQVRSHVFLAGDRLTIADFAVGGMMTYFRSAEFPFAEFPDLTAWYSRVEALQAWQETAAEPWK
jgi:glutathione S-transferase